MPRDRLQTELNMKRLLSVLLIVLVMTAYAHGDDGDLDPTFGTTTRVTTDFVYADTVNTVAIQADGKIIAAGGAFAWPKGQSMDFALARYNGDGSLDTSCGTS